MTTVQEIKQVIGHLPKAQFVEVRDWIVEMDWKAWDAEIERDSKAGKLDFLIAEAQREKASGKTRPL